MKLHLNEKLKKTTGIWKLCISRVSDVHCKLREQDEMCRMDFRNNVAIGKQAIKSLFISLGQTVLTATLHIEL